MKKQRPPFDPKSEILRWGPTPGRHLYISGFNESIFFDFPKKYPGLFWPKTLFLLQGGKIFWINDFSDLRKEGIRAFKKHILPKNSRKRLRNRWKGIAKGLDVFQEGLVAKKLEKLSDGELRKLGKQFLDLLVDFWTATIPQELGNYGSDYLLEREIRKYIPNKVERMRAMEILTAPEELSFYQQEEIELSRTKNLKKHREKYFWLRNSYNGAKILPIRFFKKRKKELPRGIEGMLTEHIQQAKRKKKIIQKKYRLPEGIMNIAEALSFGVAWQDERKGNIFKYVHYLDVYARAVAHRKKYSPEGLRDLSLSESIRSMTDDVHPVLKKRQKPFGYLLEKGRVRELSSSLTVKYWNLYEQEKIKHSGQRITGIAASVGSGKKVFGSVRIVTDPLRSNGFKRGEILVSPFTSPEYVFLMKKASAVITNAGGLTSHAAIVSRELAIPCIVGTKIATQVLKDGDLIEVDANNGIVKIIGR